MSERVRVGQVVAPFGLQGAVKVYPLTDFERRFSAGAELWLDRDRRRVEWSRRRPAGLVLKLSGVDDRTRAELCRGRYLEVSADELGPLPEGSFYHRDLVGLEVQTASGDQLGTITEVMERPANDVWVAKRNGHEQLIPATKEAVLQVDLDARRVVVADWLRQVEDA